MTCASGTDALLLAAIASGIGRGDAVFVPAFSFVATAEIVALLGATPVFVDVDADTYLIDLENLEIAINETRNKGLVPRAVIPVDLFGQPPDYSRLGELAGANGLLVIADAARG